MSEPTPVTEDGEVIGLPPEPPSNEPIVIEPEPEIINEPPPTPPGLMVDDGG